MELLTTIYQDKGYLNRKEYIKELAFEYKVPYNEVVQLALLLGASEDFDGLVSLVDELSFLKMCEANNL